MLIFGQTVQEKRMHLTAKMAIEAIRIHKTGIDLSDAIWQALNHESIFTPRERKKYRRLISLQIYIWNRDHLRAKRASKRGRSLPVQTNIISGETLEEWYARTQGHKPENG